MPDVIYGSNYLFQTLNPWVLGTIFYATLMFLVAFGRRLYEGAWYNVSYSSVLGGAALVGCMAVAGDILHRPDIQLPDWLTSGDYHLWSAAISIVIGFCMGQSADSKTTWEMKKPVDAVFNYAVAPLFFYLLATLLPVTYFQGAAAQWLITIVLLIVWAITFVLDVRTGRLHQPEWRKANPGHNFLW